MIKQALCAATMLATLSTSVTAAAAGPRDAAFASSADSGGSQPFLFSGATVRLNLDRGAESKPELALRFAGANRSDATGLKIGAGLALTSSAKGQAELTIAGQDSQVIGTRLGMSDGAKVGLIVGGIAVIAIVVLVASSGAGDAPAAFFDEE